MGTNEKKLLITGCSGAVGRAIAELALEEGWSVTGLLHKGSSRNEALSRLAGFQVIEADLSDYAELTAEDIGHADAVIHLAWSGTTGEARNDAALQLKNVEYTLEAIRLAKRIGAGVFVGAGSQAEYGVKNEPLTPFLSVNPETGYGIAKYTAGRLGAMLAENLGIRFNWIRLLSVYGPDDRPGSLISYVIRTFSEGKSPSLTPCTQVWDYLYSRDAAAAFLSCVEKGKNGKTYVIGSGEKRTLKDYVEEIRYMIAPDTEPGFGEKAFYPGQPHYLVADSSAITRDTGWVPKVNFRDGIRLLQKKLAK